MNKRFKIGLSKAAQRKSRTKKKLSFTNDFEVRGFNENHKVVNISKAKQFRESYNQSLHFG